MSRIHIVSRGWYSDYEILAVFSTEAKADEYVTFRRRGLGQPTEGPSALSIQDYPVDQPFKHYYRWWIVMNLETGKIRQDGEIWQDSADVKENPSFWEEWAFGDAEVHAYGKDREAALKSASDYRAKLLAEREGIA